MKHIEKYIRIISLLQKGMTSGYEDGWNWSLEDNDIQLNITEDEDHQESYFSRGIWY